MAPPRADWLGMQTVMDGVDSSVWEWGQVVKAGDITI